ncbi:MAG: ankyrin repeat domain-containing protein [Rubrivivax sp.]|nr:ankyrin repeat domain-containing protein [Rubrivivax sp.]MDP3222867.1 ankyrin repeat domain-containing protein [Rubrivivax sp.]MDP3613084.1 ankyrin repeat domain-containing protein [Rubrivivax sp.]
MRNYFRYVIYLLAAVCFSSAHANPAVNFFRAVNTDNERAVKSLLDQGFDPNTPNPQGQVGLFLAMRDESPKVAAVLLAHPAVRVDATTPADETPLMMACLRGNIEWARRLLDSGAALNRAGWTPLHYAASGSQTALVNLLLDRGAAIDASSPNRSTPLMMAARYGASESAELLLARGADTKARNERDLTAADFARAAGREALAARIEAATR